jgi:hypothetical protein
LLPERARLGASSALRWLPSRPDRRRAAPHPSLPQDSATLIFKAQAEVAFREQTAGHNALLLFVHLSLGIMELQLGNAFKELRVKEAEVGQRARQRLVAQLPNHAPAAAGARRGDSPA